MSQASRSYAFVLALGATILVGCGESGRELMPEEARLVGSWTLDEERSMQSYTSEMRRSDHYGSWEEGQIADFAADILSEERIEFELKDNGTFTGVRPHYGDRQLSGKWVLRGGDFLELQGENIVEFTGVVEGDSMRVLDDINPYAFEVISYVKRAD